MLMRDFIADSRKLKFDHQTNDRGEVLLYSDSVKYYYKDQCKDIKLTLTYKAQIEKSGKVRSMVNKKLGSINRHFDQLVACNCNKENKILEIRK
jgi:hypothetical protein